MMPNTTWLMRAGPLAIVAAACGASVAETPTSTTTVTMAPMETRTVPAAVYSNADAIDLIARTRCTRENICNNVGPGRAHSSYDECTADARRMHGQRLTGNVCAHGIDGQALSRCLEDYRNQACGEPGSFDVPASCAGVMLCR